MKAKSIEFEFGKNAYGQNVTAKREENYMAITTHAASQRDETARVYGITDEQMIKFAEAVKTITKR